MTRRGSVCFILVLAGVLCASWIPGARAAGIEFTCNNPIEIIPLNSAFEVDAVLRNPAAVGDRYDILRTIIHRPPNWTTPICVGSCYSDVVDSLTVLLPAGQDTTVGIQFNAADDEGGAVVLLTARSWVDPSKIETLTLAVITNGTEVLIVDDDGNQDYQDYLSAAFDAQHTWGVWPRELGAPTSADLLEFDMVAWMTGESAPALAADDTLAVAGFLDAGGRLFITGQNIGYDLCDPASPYYAAEMKAFYENRLGAQYVLDDAGILAVDGLASDPITDGLTLSISGGDGADNQTAPSEISPLGAGSTAIFEYTGTSQIAGVRVEKGASKVVYLAFGFEAISSASDRAGLAGSIFDWLSLVGSVEENLNPARIDGALRCYPNPFNPSVSISFAVSRPGPAAVNIFDVRGREVVALSVDARAAGPVCVEWDGRDAAGLPVASGLYLCRVSAGAGEALTQKLVLMK